MQKPSVSRNFIIGECWLYYKIYTGPQVADSVITKSILPISSSLINEGIIDSWFFIRYRDPDNHIRFRIHFSDIDSLSKVVYRFTPVFSQLLKNNLVWSIQVDTYERELERYGIHTMELSELFFYYDSEMIAKFLSLIQGIDEVDLRWLFALRSIDEILNGFNFSKTDKLKFTQEQKTNFGKEFNMSRSLKKQLDKKYRSKNKLIENFMQSSPIGVPYGSQILEVLSERNQNLANVIKQIKIKLPMNPSNISIEYLIRSHIHMSLNRLFKSDNRLNEMVCYDFLFRYYNSSLARMKYSLSN